MILVMWFPEVHGAQPILPGIFFFKIDVNFSNDDWNKLGIESLGRIIITCWFWLSVKFKLLPWDCRLFFFQIIIYLYAFCLNHCKPNVCLALSSNCWNWHRLPPTQVDRVEVPLHLQTIPCFILHNVFLMPCCVV